MMTMKLSLNLVPIIAISCLYPD